VLSLVRSTARAIQRQPVDLAETGVKSAFDNRDSPSLCANPELEMCMAEPVNPSENQPRPDPNEKLVKVFDSEDESEALVVKGLLDAAGIDNDLASASLLQDAFPGLGGMIILVREEDADAAQRAIAERQSLTEDDETAEIEVTEDPHRKP